MKWQEKDLDIYKDGRMNIFEEKKIKIFNNKGKTEPIFSALVSNSEQEAACREA